MNEMFEVAGHIQVDIECPAGTVIVESGPPDCVEVDISASREDWRAEHRAGTILVRPPRSSRSGGGRGDVILRVPVHTDVTVRAGSASVRLVGSFGRTEIAAGSGDIAIDDVASLDARTASGDVRVSSVSNEVVVKSASGQLDAERIVGDITVTTASGDIRISEAAGALRASSASGDVRIGQFDGADAKVSSMSGDISIGLQTGRVVKLDAKTVSGRVDLPPKRDGEFPPPNAPVVHLELKSVSGDVRLQRIG